MPIDIADASMSPNPMRFIAFPLVVPAAQPRTSEPRDQANGQSPRTTSSDRCSSLTSTWHRHGANITDIGSFRAIKAQTLLDLDMEQMTYGWPVEMVVKAARSGLIIQSVPINYRKRIGESKVTGTIRGSILAAYYMRV